MVNDFLKKILGQTENTAPDIRGYFFKRNVSGIKPTALIVLGVSIYWLVIDKFSASYNLDIYCKVGIIAQVIVSIYIFLIFLRKKKYSHTFIRFNYLLFYLVIIVGVFTLILARNKRIIASGDINNDIGVSVSAFYVFILSFNPLPDKLDSIIILLFMVAGVVGPEIICATSTYSLFCHIILTSCFMACYVYIRNTLIENGKHEALIASLNTELSKNSYCDGLTGVLNRRAFDSYIDYLKNNSKTHQIGVLFFDIDYFKKFNDYYGHPKGDEILCKIAKRVEKYMGQYNNCYLFRYGGEEFVGVVDGVDENLFTRILLDINETINELDIKRDDVKEFDHLTISVGGSIESIPNRNNDYVTNADTQLYLGKNSGRNSSYYKNKCLQKNEDIQDNQNNVNGNYIMSSVLNDLCQNVYDIYSVNCKTKRVTVYRSGGKVLGISRVLKNDYDYDSSFRAYIENNIHPLDREEVYRKIDFNSVYTAVKQHGVVSVYYRVLRDGVTSFYKIKFMPMGSKDNFESMVCAFLPEEEDVGRIQSSSISELDELTNVYTKQAFYHYARRCLEMNANKHFHIVISDIENFRFVNGIYGQTKANEVLQFLTSEFTKITNCRVLGRYGSDQFIMLIEDNEELDNAGFRTLIQSIKTKSPIPYLSIKFGKCAINDINEPINAVSDRAIIALGGIKHHEDYPVSEFDDSVIKQQERNQIIESGFEKALAQKEFVVYCQPKYRTTSKRVCGGEALVKWKMDNGELVQPFEFIPIFERSGVINRLDEYVFRFVCEKQKELIEEGIVPFPISVNVSRNTVFQPSMLDRYVEIIESIGLDKRLVPLEITESWAAENYSIKEYVDKIKEAGFVLHLDDFGTGYSSLSSLNTLPIDVVKLDKTLIDSIGDPRGNELLHHIVELSHFLHMEVVAEGVEEERQFNFLKDLNCEIIQGYYFSKAVEFDKYLALIEKAKNN